jgi:hypothetical protein
MENVEKVDVQPITIVEGLESLCKSSLDFGAASRSTSLYIFALGSEVGLRKVPE